MTNLHFLILMLVHFLVFVGVFSLVKKKRSNDYGSETMKEKVLNFTALTVILFNTLGKSIYTIRPESYIMSIAMGFFGILLLESLIIFAFTVLYRIFSPVDQNRISMAIGSEILFLISLAVLCLFGFYNLIIYLT